MSYEGRIQRVKRAWKYANEARENNMTERWDMLLGLTGPNSGKCKVREETRTRFEALFARRG
jgi:hypothetical protein